MLNDRLNSYLCYFERLATQPANRWEGYYLSEGEEQVCALRFQIAFVCYALATLCNHPEATTEQQQRCRSGMEALIARMLQRRVWAYWGRHADKQGISTDPLIERNAEYSGPLAMMLGAYKAAGGDGRYEEGFTLLWNSDGRFEYTHSGLVEVLWQQMRSSSHHGVESAPGQLSVVAMSHVLWGTQLHDQLHGSAYGDCNQLWLDFVGRKMALGGPRIPGRGAFSRGYMTRLGRGVPLSSNLVDGWALALLAPIAPDFTRTLAPRFLARIRRSSDGSAYVPCASGLGRRELCDVAVASGFGYLLAVELGDAALAEGMLRYAEAHFQPSERDGERCYAGSTVVPFATALFAIGEAGGLARLWQPVTEEIV